MWFGLFMAVVVAIVEIFDLDFYIKDVNAWVAFMFVYVLMIAFAVMATYEDLERKFQARKAPRRGNRRVAH